MQNDIRSALSCSRRVRSCKTTFVCIHIYLSVLTILLTVAKTCNELLYCKTRHFVLAIGTLMRGLRRVLSA